MALKVEVMESTTIKPSSTTPHHLKTFKLSLIDQLMAPIPTNVILFYSEDQQSKYEAQVDLLKRSLSMTLTHFYPLAGRIGDNRHVDCNDDGVNFVKTHVVNTDLREVVSNPKAEKLAQLLPTDNFTGGLGPKVLLSIQANIFNCGGIALGVKISHKVADASALSLLLSNWASIARTGEAQLAPELDNTSLFPPLDFSLPIPAPKDPYPNVVSRRFIFSGSNIAALKSKTSSIQVPHPTKVEAVMALIWWCCMRAEPVKRASAAYIPVNLRGKMVPPLSHHFGNIMTVTTTDTEHNQPELNFLVIQLRESIRKIDCDYYKTFGSHDRFWAYLGSTMEALAGHGSGEVEYSYYTFTSWCRFPLYEIDFGWGKPVWASFGEFCVGKLAVMVDTKCGKGVEAWVSLDEAHMSILESVPELLFFTSTNPSQDLPETDHINSRV